MATEKYVKGHNFRLFVDGVGVGHAKSCSYSWSADKKEITDKDVDPGATTPGAVAITLGKQRISVKVTGYVWESDNGTTASTGGYRTHLNNAFDGTLVEWLFGTTVTGDTKIEGEGYITSFEATGDDPSEAEYSFTIDATGSFAAGIIT